MRAQEFIAEYKEHFNGIDLSLEVQKDDEYVDDEDTENQVVFVKATANGKDLGYVIFTIEQDSQGQYLYPQDLEVEERFRGQGVAKIMYDYVKSKGYRIRRSGQQTDAGAGFWAKHRPEQNIWEDELDEGWKDWVAGAAMGAAALGASPDASAAQKHHVPVAKVQMQKITPAQSRGGESPAELKAYVEAMAQKYLPADQVAQFVGQVAHETANFTSMIEQNPEKNLKHYAKAKNPLGNKGMSDAQKYIGRGFLQITGKYNYKHFGDKIRPGLGDELVKNPDLAMRKDVAIALAVMFWRERVAPKMAAGASNREIATAINGRKPKGLASRNQYVKMAAATPRTKKG